MLELVTILEALLFAEHNQLPSNLVLKKFTPSRWIAFIATSWGIVSLKILALLEVLAESWIRLRL